MRSLPIALVLASLALGGAGCFAFEEIDQGQEIMDRHFRGGEQADAQATEGEASEPDEAAPGLLARVQSWWAGEGSEDAAPPAPSGPPPHPENVPRRCEIDGSTQFMRKFDCQLRGGTYTPVEPRAAR